jgi:hypothetical protein
VAVSIIERDGGVAWWAVVPQETPVPGSSETVATWRCVAWARQLADGWQVSRVCGVRRESADRGGALAMLLRLAGAS